MEALYSNWFNRWQASLGACQRKGGEAVPLIVMPPATEQAVAEVETQLGVVLPSSFRTALLEFASHIEVHWLLSGDAGPPGDNSLPRELHGIFGGGVFWDLTMVARYEKSRVSWLESNFPDPDDPYDRVWHNKLAFDEVANGDILAFDMELMPDPPVVYLSHEHGLAHGYRLGNNFADFMERWSLLGCPGNDECQMMPFLPDATSGLEVYGENARKWREWSGLNFEVNKQ